MILTVEIAEKRFGARAILGPLDFTLDQGEILAIVGPSGCGKTTLLGIVGGLDADYRGRVRWHGPAAPRIGTVFQAPRLLPWRTVRQNLDLMRPPGSDAAARDRLLDRLGLASSRDAFASELSLGMARRLALARALVVEPDLVLLDEPFVSLDEAAAAVARQVLLDAWRARPAAMLLVTHDLGEAAALADRILLLSRDPARAIDMVSVPAPLRRAGGGVAHELAGTLRQRLGGPPAPHFLAGG